MGSMVARSAARAAGRRARPRPNESEPPNERRPMATTSSACVALGVPGAPPKAKRIAAASGMASAKRPCGEARWRSRRPISE